MDVPGQQLKHGPWTFIVGTLKYKDSKAVYQKLRHLLFAGADPEGKAKQLNLSELMHLAADFPEKDVDFVTDKLMSVSNVFHEDNPELQPPLANLADSVFAADMEAFHEWMHFAIMVHYGSLVKKHAAEKASARAATDTSTTKPTSD